MRRVLGRKFFTRSAVVAARELVGKYLVRRHVGRDRRGGGGRTEAFMITETEAYDGFRDLASHAHRGQTASNAPMFGGAGRWYVYFVYGMHWMLNAVTGPKGYPAAVLIRGVRGFPGPARLTRRLGIARPLNGKSAVRVSGLWIEDRGTRLPKRFVRRSPRIGVAYAGPVWANKPYRFTLSDEWRVASE